MDALLLPTRGERMALRVLQIGFAAAVVAVSIRHVFELDRFLVPKELALHATALLAALLLFGAMRRVAMTRVDRLLLVYLLLSAMSAALATNRWLGLRAFTVSVSSYVVFRAARALRAAGLARPLLHGIAFAVVLAAITALLQAYGVVVDVFAVNRAPGGTLGNRNFVGHAAAFGLPVVLYAAMRARSIFAWCGVTLVSAALVLTRSRAAWLAAAAVLLVFVAAMLFVRALRGSLGRLALALLFIAVGAAAAIVIPNELRWRSDNPYLESAKSVTSYAEGSGHGRLVHYERSMVMAVRHPLFGAGPGNWPVDYPDHAARNDPSMNDSEPGMTFNPWPSSDWVAFISERGFLAAIVLGLAFLTLLLGALRALAAALELDEALQATALLGTLAGALLTGAFDAVLLLALPSLLVWAAIGALWSPPLTAEARAMPRLVAIALVVVALAGVARSAMQVAAMEIFATSWDRTELERAAQLDPGNYRVQLRLGRRSCDHAAAAHALFPHARAARSLAARCH
ncbi:MAG TPA: O-antigen ligase family protein [Thermoanaerobaculia bacterium]